MLAGGLERSGQRNAGDPTFGPHPPLTNPPAAGGAGGADGLFTHTPAPDISGYLTSKLIPALHSTVVNPQLEHRAIGA